MSAKRLYLNIGLGCLLGILLVYGPIALLLYTAKNGAAKMRKERARCLETRTIEECEYVMSGKKNAGQ